MIELPRRLGASLRFLAALGVALLLVSAFAAPVRAGVTGEIDVFIELPDGDGEFTRQTDPIQLRRSFNNARCTCAELGADFAEGTDYSRIQVKLEGSYTLTPDTRSNANLDVGSDCINADQDTRDANCENVLEISDIVAARGGTFEVPLHSFMFSEGQCQATTDSSRIWITFDDNTDGVPDEIYFTSDVVEIDAEPPPRAVDPSAEPGENAVVLSWTNPESRGTDIEHYQVLCVENNSESPVFSSPDEAEYEHTLQLCNVTGSISFSNLADSSAGNKDSLSYLGGADGGMADAGPDSGMSDAGPDAGDGEAGIPEVLSELNPLFICGSTNGTAEELRIDGLENGVSYHFLLMAIDDVGNFNSEYLGPATPVPVIDFWEDYRRSGGDAEGGICLITSTFGDDHWFTQTLRDFRDRTLAQFGLGRALIDFYYEYVAGLGIYAERSLAVKVVAAVVIAPLVGVAAFWEYTGPGIKILVLLGVIWWFRRRRARRAGRTQAPPRAIFWRPRRWQLACAGFAGIWLVAAPAFAQSPFDPYWEEFQPVENRTPPEPAKWNFGIKAGPYLPAVDDSVSQPGDGPWERVFGGAGFRLDIELDRYFMWSVGQLGVTTSIGFMGKTARAFETESCDTNDADCINGIRPIIDDNGNPKRSAEKTSFRLFPVSAGVVYRFTALDDQLRIPIVPYGKAALSYYLWWITGPGGSIAEAAAPDCPAPGEESADCDRERALGASLGFQLTVGLAIRAERLDKQAALSLRNDLGIDHAGFYAELTYAKVDGFGSESKLPVGDLTWFGGLNFEF